MPKLDKRDEVVSVFATEAVNAAKAAPAPEVPQRAPELAAHSARISRETNRQGKLS